MGVSDVEGGRGRGFVGLWGGGGEVEEVLDLGADLLAG